MCVCLILSSFFFIDPPTTAIYTLSLHDALPISPPAGGSRRGTRRTCCRDWRAACPPTAHRTSRRAARRRVARDRKSTRLNSSHTVISYAVFCLKKKKQQ